MGQLATPAYRRPRRPVSGLWCCSAALSAQPATVGYPPGVLGFFSRAFRCMTPAYPAGVAAGSHAPSRIEGHSFSGSALCVAHEGSVWLLLMLRQDLFA